MIAIEVTTQKQLDAALAKLKAGDWVVCLGGTWDAPLVVPGSASVTASGSASVRAYGSASVTAYGSASVRAYESAAIHKHPGGKQKITGGVVIEVPDLDQLDTKAWCAYYGVDVARGYAVVFKCVDDDYATDFSRNAGIFYTPGTKIAAPDWKPTKKCGNGLHASPRPWMAREYHDGTRYVAVKCKVADLVVIGDKVKAPALAVLHEVNEDGEPV